MSLVARSRLGTRGRILPEASGRRSNPMDLEPSASHSPLSALVEAEASAQPTDDTSNITYKAPSLVPISHEGAFALDLLPNRGLSIVTN